MSQNLTRWQAAVLGLVLRGVALAINFGGDDSLNFRAPFGAYDKAEGTW